MATWTAVRRPVEEPAGPRDAASRLPGQGGRHRGAGLEQEARRDQCKCDDQEPLPEHIRLRASASLFRTPRR